jgi:Thioredoxin domain-containing protein
MTLIKLTDDDFAEMILNAPGAVMVDFYAGWCRWCRVMEPNVVRLSEDAETAGKVFAADIDSMPETAGKYNIRTVPTLIVFSGGREVCRKTGTRSYRAMKKMLLTAAGEK